MGFIWVDNVNVFRDTFEGGCMLAAPHVRAA